MDVLDQPCAGAAGHRRRSEPTLRQVAATCRITERTAQAIVADLEQAGYLHRQRVGRRNQYTLHLDKRFRHPADAAVSVRGLVQLFADRTAGTAPSLG